MFMIVRCVVLLLCLSDEVAAFGRFATSTLRFARPAHWAPPAVQSLASSSLPCFVINLERDKARLASVTEELSSNGDGVEFTRFPATDGRALTDSELRQNTTWLGRHLCTRGMIGCYCSHRRIWEMVAESYDVAMVLEDDVALSTDFSDRAEAAVKELETAVGQGEWDVLMLGALGCVEPNGRYGANRLTAAISGGMRRTRRLSERIHVPQRPYGTHAYLLSRRGAKKLLERVPLAVHHVDNVAWGVQSLELYLTHPMLAFQKSEAPSTVGANENGIEARLPSLVLDAYTGVTLKWTWNEPIVRFGPLTMTLGRCLSAIAAGYALAALTASRRVLCIHTALTLANVALTRVLASGWRADGRDKSRQRGRKVVERLRLPGRGVVRSVRAVLPKPDAKSDADDQGESAEIGRAV